MGTKIYINGKEYIVGGAFLDYERILEWAGLSRLREDVMICASCPSAKDFHDQLVKPGQKIELRSGMDFQVGNFGPEPETEERIGSSPMSDKEFARRLKNIADLARKQRSGQFSIESDAAQSLELVETIALLIIANLKAKSA